MTRYSRKNKKNVYLKILLKFSINLPKPDLVRNNIVQFTISILKYSISQIQYEELGAFYLLDQVVVIFRMELIFSNLAQYDIDAILLISNQKVMRLEF